MNIDAREELRRSALATLAAGGTSLVSVRCPRCGQDGVADRFDVSGFDEPPGSQWVWGWLICATEGCFDEEGLPRIPPPDTPGELTHEDRQWIKRHQRLAGEDG